MQDINYNSCYWYPYLILNNVPTIKSIIIETDNLDSIRNEIDDNINEYPFVRLCNASPKDYHKGCIFQSAIQVVEALENSARTWFMLNTKITKHKICVMMREKVEIDYEVRCFYNNGLRAVSCNYCKDDFVNINEFENIIIDFFEIYGDKMPYEQSTIDLGINKDFDDAFIIEFNSFGINSKAGAELFDWREDFHILYHSDIPTFKYKSYFEW